MLAMNFLLDRSAEGWARDLGRLKAQVGDCDTSSPVATTGALSGEFTWRCASTAGSRLPVAGAHPAPHPGAETGAGPALSAVPRRARVRTYLRLDTR